MRGSTIRTAAAAIVLAAESAAAALPGFVLTARTERGAYFSHTAARPDVAKIEAFVKRLEGLLETSAPPARYYLYEDAQQLAAGTGLYGAGLTDLARHEVHSTLTFHQHELVHLVASGLGNPGVFFHEGLAVALGTAGRWRGKPVDKLARGHVGAGSMEDLVRGFAGSDPDVAYPIAGSFVGWLIRNKGLDALRRFFRAERGPRAFPQAFGLGLEEAGDAWRRSLGPGSERRAAAHD
jgi:hypothetical protein